MRAKFFLPLFLPLLFVAKAEGHKLLCEAIVAEDGSAVIEAFFPSGRPASGVEVGLFRGNGSLLCEGVTDEKGQFEPPGKLAAGTWCIVARGAMGHRVEKSFAVGGAAAEREARGGPPSRGDRREPVPWTAVVAGFAFLLALYSLIMTLKLRADMDRAKNAPPRNR